MLDEATGKWGIRINRVEIKSVDPPADIKAAMEKQMRAERDRRAAILTAEGTKQAAILTAEGEQRAAVLTAEGARQAAILRAEGEAKAIATVFDAIHARRRRPQAALLPVPADAAEARRGRRQQGLRDPVGVHAGLRRHRRRGRRAAARPDGPAELPPGDGDAAAEPEVAPLTSDSKIEDLLRDSPLADESAVAGVQSKDDVLADADSGATSRVDGRREARRRLP